MKTKIYFYKNNAYNAVVFDQENGFYFLYEGQEIKRDGRYSNYIDGIVDLYSEDAIAELKEYYTDLISAGQIDLSGLCTSNFVFAGAFDASGNDESAELITEYEDEDYKPYIEGLI